MRNHGQERVAGQLESKSTIWWSSIAKLLAWPCWSGWQSDLQHYGFHPDHSQYPNLWESLQHSKKSRPWRHLVSTHFPNQDSLQSAGIRWSTQQLVAPLLPKRVHQDLYCQWLRWRYWIYCFGNLNCVNAKPSFGTPAPTRPNHANCS